MRNINKVIVVGRLTRDPEVRRTQSGLPIMTIGVAVNDSRKNPSTGEWEDYANFVDCTLMGDRAEKLEPMLHKGMKVCIDGKLHYSSWEKDGQKRSKLDVTVDQIEFIGKREQEPEPTAEVYDFDIPF